MDMLIIVRQGLLFLHLCAFAIALAEILRGDLRLLRAAAIDVPALHRTAQLVSATLLLLWLTGLGLMAFDTGFEPASIAAKPKLVAKLLVVTALTANGVLLHRFAFPLIGGRSAAPDRSIALVAALGAVSTVSWLYAAFLGSARLIAGYMDLTGFLLLYGISIATGIAVAVIGVAPLLTDRISARRPRRVGDEAAWAADSDTSVPAAIEEPVRRRA